MRNFIILMVTVVLACGDDGAGPSANVASILINPSAATLGVGQSQQFNAAALDASDGVLSGARVSWTVGSTSIATVDQTGRVTAVAAGATKITASSGGRSASANLTVSPGQSATGDVMLNPGVAYQTMHGWEATAWVGQWACAGVPFPTEIYQRYRDPLFDAVFDLGINRIRLEVRASAERPDDPFGAFRDGSITEQQYTSVWYEAINDNTNPGSINASGYNFTEMDLAVETAVLPLKQRLEAAGEQLYLNLNFIKFKAGGLDFRNNPAEYAEFMVATFQHLRDRWNLVPDAVEIILEPDNTEGGWSGTQIGNAIVATANRLRTAGFTPEFIGPSGMTASRALELFDEMVAVSGVPQVISELAYHRYGTAPSAQLLQSIAQRGIQYGVRTAMTEHIGSGYVHLHEDLKLARNSAWQQYTLAGCAPNDTGGRHFLIDASNPTNPIVRLASRSQYLRQYFKYIRRGATRVDATTGRSGLDPLAFINSNGKYAVVVKSGGASNFTIGGLPPGRYGVSYTTGPDDHTVSQFGVELPEIVLEAGKALSTGIPGRGVLTVYAK
ncbi:MAG TPA: Ig-like domain-containing protein [Longimicrobiales bacterium]|nr:Ig-like domain-containing protein [Longimicrobiales bacterium]